MSSIESKILESEIFLRRNIDEFIEKIKKIGEFTIHNKKEEFTHNTTKNITDANLCIAKTTDDNLNKILNESIKKSRRNNKIDFITIYNSEEEILGVLICESTENDIWALDLICSKSGIGIYLIGCFLYCLKIMQARKIYTKCCSDQPILCFFTSSTVITLLLLIS